MPNIGFEVERQKLSNWCWAAVAVSVSRYFDRSSKWRQCGVATYVLKSAKGDDAPKVPACGCCNRPIPDECNEQWYLEDALEQVGRLKGNAREGHLSFAAVRRRLDNARPVCIRIKWRRGGGHFVVVTGYHVDRSGVQKLVVQDPAMGGERIVNYSTLVSNYRGQGRWSHTYPV
jgi:hypothetical protein